MVFIWRRTHSRYVASFTITPSEDGATLHLAGKMTVASLGEVRRAISAVEQGGSPVVLDLGELTLVDRHSVDFLAERASEGITLVDCPTYLRRWIVPGSGNGHRLPAA